MLRPDIDRISDMNWPPHCCVPAYVVAALSAFGFKVRDNAAVARELGILVGPDDLNPWQLPVTALPDARGIAPADAIARIPALIRRYHSSLSFRHLRFSHIPCEMYREVFIDARSRCCVGVGFSYSRLITGDANCRHVTRLEPGDTENQAFIVDDSAKGESHSVSWDSLEAAVRAANDGFWIIGSRADLELRYTPPWSCS